MLDAIELSRSCAEPSLPRRSSALTVHHDKYLRRTVTSPYNLLAPVGFALCVLLTGAWAPALVGLAMHLAGVLVLPRRAWFRAYVDRLDAQAEAAELATIRAQLLQRVSDGHRRSFEYLEALARRISDHMDSLECGETVDCFGLSSLLSSYLRLAIAHREAEQHLALTTRHTLIAEIDELRSIGSSMSPQMRHIRGQHLSIAEKRLERWDQTADLLACMKSQMATIDSLLHLAYESAVIPSTLQSTSASVNAAIAEFAAEHAALRELSSISIEEHIDPRIFQLRPAPLQLVAASEAKAPE